MSQLKHTAILKGDVLQDVATGQLFKLHPTEEEMQRGIWEYHPAAEVLIREVEDVLFGLECYLEAELGWMDSMGDEADAESDDDSDDDYDATTEDEGYNTSPEVDFDQYDYWALGLNSFLWRIDLYKEGEDGCWTL